jgi:hypothetical protein
LHLILALEVKPAGRTSRGIKRHSRAGSEDEPGAPYVYGELLKLGIVPLPILSDLYYRYVRMP